MTVCANPKLGRRAMLVNLHCAAVIAIAITVNGCSTGQRRPHYQTISPTAHRDSLSAQKLNDEGLALIEEGDIEGAERKFRNALYYAPAHNNLGLVLLQSQRHYEAACEFDYATKLHPHASEPRENLGLLYESVGRLDRAITEYEMALEIAPEKCVTMRHLARAYVKAGRKGHQLKELLEKLLLIPSDHQWDVWIRGQVIRLGRVETRTDPPQLGMYD